jgi:hypothetical protein
MMLYLFRPRFGSILVTIMERHVRFDNRKTILQTAKKGSVSSFEPAGYGGNAETLWRPSRCSATIAEMVLQIMAMSYISVTWHQSNHPRTLMALQWMMIFLYPWPILIFWSLDTTSTWSACFISYEISWAFFIVMVINAGHLCVVSSQISISQRLY